MAASSFRQRTWKKAVFWLSAALACAWAFVLVFSCFREVAYYGARDCSQDPTSWPVAVPREWVVRHVLIASRGVLSDSYRVSVPDDGPGVRVSSVWHVRESPWVPRIRSWPTGLFTCSLPMWIPVSLFALIAWLFRHALRKPHPGFCPRCGYNLTDNVSGVCPECGLAIAKPGTLSGAGPHPGTVP